MNVYIVREAGTTKVHGIFWAETPEDLWMAVDEMGDPVAFEACEVTGPSGVYTNVPMDEAKPTWEPGMPEDDALAFPNPLTEAGDFLIDALSEETPEKWVRFDEASSGAGMVAKIRKEAGA